MVFFFFIHCSYSSCKEYMLIKVIAFRNLSIPVILLLLIFQDISTCRLSQNQRSTLFVDSFLFDQEFFNTCNFLQFFIPPSRPSHSYLFVTGPFFYFFYFFYYLFIYLFIFLYPGFIFLLSFLNSSILLITFSGNDCFLSIRSDVHASVNIFS